MKRIKEKVQINPYSLS